MLAAPGANLIPVENAIVIGIHFVEMCGSSLCRPLLRTLQVLLPGDAAGRGRRRRNGCGGGSRAFNSGGLWTGLRKGSRGKQ